MKLSEYFTLEEMTLSQEAVRRGLKNIPSPKRKGIVIVSSGYRSKQLNDAIHGAKNSQHCTGQAADFIVQGINIDDLFLCIKKSGILYDQLINEFGQWIHVSYLGETSRNQSLWATRQGGVVNYVVA